MAEYVEVMKQKKRMCSSILCCTCDIFHLSGAKVGSCSQFISNNPSEAEKIIMTWAAEHPEPVYPTWGEWLMSIGVINGVHPHGAIDALGNLKQPIPAEFAEKLEIEPKPRVYRSGKEG